MTKTTQSRTVFLASKISYIYSKCSSIRLTNPLLIKLLHSTEPLIYINFSKIVHFGVNNTSRIYILITQIPINVTSINNARLHSSKVETFLTKKKNELRKNVRQRSNRESLLTLSLVI